MCVCLTVVSTFVLLWLPYLVHNVMVLAGQYKPLDGNTFTDVVEAIALLNAIIDPVLFLWLSKETKKEFRVVIGSISERTSSEIHSRSTEI